MNPATPSFPAVLLDVTSSSECPPGLYVENARECRAVCKGFCAPVSSSAGCAEPARILLADDEMDLWWEECLAALARAGHHVDTAEDGGAAWEALQTNEYDLLITDNKMPKLWGLDLIIKLRAQGMALPIIFASSLLPMIVPEQKPYFVNVHFLEKPVSSSQLLATLDYALLHDGLASHRFAPTTN